MAVGSVKQWLFTINDKSFRHFYDRMLIGGKNVCIDFRADTLKVRCKF